MLSFYAIYNTYFKTDNQIISYGGTYVCLYSICYYTCVKHVQKDKVFSKYVNKYFHIQIQFYSSVTCYNAYIWFALNNNTCNVFLNTGQTQGAIIF